jgi:Zn-dependent peptidase ImmA (M78 family)
MNLICAFLLLAEFYLIFLIISILYAPCIEEEFDLQDDQEPKLLLLQEKLSPLFEENCSYQGTILEGIMTLQTKRRIQNEISLSKGKKSYTINKEDIFLCLLDENGNYYDDNMLIYVLLHEISHSVCNEIGHTEKFNKIFHAFIKKAVELQIYDNTKPLIRNYCLYNKDDQ